MKVRQRGFQIVQARMMNGFQSIRSLAVLTQISNSSVHRHQPAMKLGIIISGSSIVLRFRKIYNYCQLG